MENKLKILIIEDEEALQRILKDKFTEEGFEIFQAKNGLEGYEMALKIQPDLILLDIMMPVLDGLAMLKKLRGESDFGKNVPVIVLTNLSDSKNISTGIEHKVTHYWVKSDWKINDLINQVKLMIEAYQRTYHPKSQ